MRLSRGKHVIAIDQHTAEAVCSCGWELEGERVVVLNAAFRHAEGRA